MALSRPATTWTGEFDPAELTVSWNDGVLNVAGEHANETRGVRRTYHRRFRFPRAVDDEDIHAEYQNGILAVTLPVALEEPTTGAEIRINH